MPSDDDQDKSAPPKPSEDDGEASQSGTSGPVDLVEHSADVNESPTSSGENPDAPPGREETAFTAESGTSSTSTSHHKRRKRLPVVFSYASRNRPRQPFLEQSPRSTAPASLPHPPAYYRNAVSPEQHQPQQIQRTAAESRSGDSSVSRHSSPAQQQQQQQQAQRSPNQIISIIPHRPLPPMPPLPAGYIMGAACWAPYPDRISPNTPAYLGHLDEVDTLFMIQNIDIVELYITGGEAKYYIIQNKHGQCIYYAYATSDSFARYCCCSNHGVQFHVMDMYHNEIIYINKLCGSFDCICCFPAFEVYSPPLVPLGAIVKDYKKNPDEFAILDADENQIYKMTGSVGKSCAWFCDYYSDGQFTICALDDRNTEVAVIRREFGEMWSIPLGNFYGITFAKDLEVRVKAIFLGALFLIDEYYD